MVEPALRVSGLSAGYGATPVLRDIHFSVLPGQMLLVLGRNGSGRSTLLKALMGLIPSQGNIELHGQACHAWPTHQRARHGLGYVPETRDIFPGLTVEQNLALGRWQRSPGALGWGALSAATSSRSARAAEHVRPVQAIAGVAAQDQHWDVLRERRSVPAGLLSGGEQQMLSLARTLVGQPRVVLADEPTEGLAPQRVAEVAAQLQATRRAGTAWVVVEQKLQWALPLAHRVLVLGRGEVVFEGTPDQLQAHSAVWRQWILG